MHSQGHLNSDYNTLSSLDSLVVSMLSSFMCVKSFASSLHSLLEMWGMSEDIFSLGFTSRFIANQLALLPAARARRKVL